VFEEEVGDVPPVTEHYMTAADVSFEKYARLIPYGQVVFHEVRLWNKFRTIQAGGNKKKDQHRQDAGYVNRFLAFCGFTGYYIRAKGDNTTSGTNTSLKRGPSQGFCRQF